MNAFICWMLALCLVACASGLPSQAETGADEADALYQRGDGTVTVTGTVIGEWQGCEVDGTCGVWLRVGQQQIGLVTAEGDVECKNQKAARTGSQLKRGQRVKAYGAYTDGKVTFCGSDAFYVVPEEDDGGGTAGAL